MAISWSELGLDPSQIEHLREHGYDTPDDVAMAIAGAPEAFEGVVDQISVARICKLVGVQRREPLPPLGVPLAAPPHDLATADPDFQSKRDAIVRELNDAQNEEDRRQAEARLLELYSRS